MLILRRYLYVSPSNSTIMAIIENMWLRKSRKRVAGAVLYQAMEQTRMRELAKSVSNPRTQSQMNQRVKWSQLVNFYRANGQWMKYAYETKKAAQSEYNKFMSLNVASSQVYFTKDQAAAGSCIVSPYIMTQGSLPSIEFTAENGSWPSNIYFPDGSTLLSTTTIAELSQKMISQNPAIRQGDQLSFIRFTQMFNGDTGYPYVIVRTYEMIVDQTSTELVGTYLPLDYIGIAYVGGLPQLAVIDSGNAGGFLMCLSRTTGGKTYVSSQSIITTGMDATIANYGSDAQLAAAIASYGENADAFLSSTQADQDNQAPTPLAIVGVQVGETTFLPGSRVEMTDNFEAGDRVTIIFNNDVPDQDPTSIGLNTTAQGVTLSSPSHQGNTVYGTIPAGKTFLPDELLSVILVRFSGNIYNAVFNSAVPFPS